MTRRSPFKTLFAAAKSARFSSRTRSSSRLTRAAGGRRVTLQLLDTETKALLADDTQKKEP